MGMAREFWGWDKPVLELAVEVLARRAGTVSPPDLSHLLVIVPTRQAGRRLRERLATWAAEHGTGVFPPHILQPDGLLSFPSATVPAGGTSAPPHFNRNDKLKFLPSASAEEILMAFVDVLRGRDPAEFRFLLPWPVTAGPLDFRNALDIASKLGELRRILGEKGLGFAEVPALLEERMEGDTERWEPERWDDLARIEQLYLERLAAAGLADPNAVRRAAAENPVVPEGVREILLLGVPDPAPLAVDALAKLVERGVPVTVCVHAPPELHEQFDDWGRPIAKFWLNRQVDIADEEIRLTGLPADAAREVADWIGRAQAAPADIAVGVPDEAVIPHLRRILAAVGPELFHPAGKPLAAHTAAHLMLKLAELRVEGRFATFSALLRHPDFQQHLHATLGGFDLESLLTAADTFQNEHLPETLDDCMNRCDGATVEQYGGEGKRQKAEGGSEHRPSNSDGLRPAACSLPSTVPPSHRHTATPVFFAAAAEAARLVAKVGDDLRGLAGVIPQAQVSFEVDHQRELDVKRQFRRDIKIFRQRNIQPHIDEPVHRVVGNTGHPVPIHTGAEPRCERAPNELHHRAR